MRSGNARRTTRARELRSVENEAENVLWQELRGRRLNGFKFVRQLPICPYFADSACRQANLVVEVDGSQHANLASDGFRDNTMNGNGWSVLRVSHADILSGKKAVMETILAVLDGRLKEKTISAEMRYLPAITSRALP